MLIFNSLSEVPAGFGPSVVAIGKFNGVHLGHREMIRVAREQAQANGAKTVVVTFDRHPASLLHPERVPADITGSWRKLDLLESAGVEATLVLPFTRELAALTPDEFVTNVLVDALHTKAVIIGHDFRFGREAAGDARVLRSLGEQHGFSVHEIADVAPESGRRVSSSWIRELIESGDVTAANALLGRTHAMRGEVVHGEARGRLLGYPTANLSADASGCIPADGTYAGWLIDQDGTRYPAAISVGTNPTFEGVRSRRVEAHVIGGSLDLYGHTVVVEFVAYIRGMYKFDAIEKLIEQMDDDVVRINAILATQP